MVSHQHAKKRRRQPNAGRAAEPELPTPLANDPLSSSRVDGAREASAMLATVTQVGPAQRGCQRDSASRGARANPRARCDPARFAHERKEPAVLLHAPGRAPSPSGAIGGDSRHGADHGCQVLTGFDGGPAAVVPKFAETHMAGLVSGLRDTSGRCQRLRHDAAGNRSNRMAAISPSTIAGCRSGSGGDGLRTESLPDRDPGGQGHPRGAGATQGADGTAVGSGRHRG